MRLAAKIAAAAALALTACGQLLDLDQFESTTGAGGAAGAADTGGGGAGGDASASVGTGGMGVSGGSAIGGGGSLPCDPGWAFAPDPPLAGQSFTLTFEHTTPYVYVALIVDPAGPVVMNGQATQGTPNIWDWHIVAEAGVYTFYFTHKIAQDSDPAIASTCTKAVMP